MATGAVPASCMGLKSRDSSLGFGKCLDFVRVCDLNRIKFNRKRISFIRNSNISSDIAEVHPASEGSPLLGISSITNIGSLFFQLLLISYVVTCSCTSVSCYSDLSLWLPIIWKKRQKKNMYWYLYITFDMQKLQKLWLFFSLLEYMFFSFFLPLCISRNCVPFPKLIMKVC